VATARTPLPRRNPGGDVCRFNGKPVATESDIPFKEKLLGLMGIGDAPNGDVWIADSSGIKVK